MTKRVSFTEMDKILQATLSSDHPEELKKELIERVTVLVPMVRDHSTIYNMVKFCVNTIITSDDDFKVAMTKRVLNALIRAHANVSSNLFSKELTAAMDNGLFRSHHGLKGKCSLLELLSHVISLVKSAAVEDASILGIMDKVIICFLEENSVRICGMLAELIIQNWQDGMVRQREKEFITKIINLLHSYSLKVDPICKNSVYEMITIKVYAVNLVSSLFAKVIETNQTCVNFALGEIFNALCNEETPPSVTVAPLLTSIPSEYAKFAAESVCNNHSITERSIKLIMCKLIDWLAWPASQKLDSWIITLCDCLLMEPRRHKLVAEVIEQKAIVVCTVKLFH